MKTFKIPADITLKDKLSGEAGQSISFKQFLTLGLMTDQRFGNSYQSLKKASRIEDAVVKAVDGVVKIDVADWELLRDVAQAPANGMYGGFNPLAMSQLIPFIDAIVGAGEDA